MYIALLGVSDQCCFCILYSLVVIIRRSKCFIHQLSRYPNCVFFRRSNIVIRDVKIPHMYSHYHKRNQGSKLLENQNQGSKLIEPEGKKVPIWRKTSLKLLPFCHNFYLSQKGSKFKSWQCSSPAFGCRKVICPQITFPVGTKPT